MYPERKVPLRARVTSYDARMPADTPNSSPAQPGLPTAMFLDALRELLFELIEGPRDPKRTWVVSNEAGSGLLGTLAGVSAEAASRPAGAGRRSIAAHAEHVRVGLTIALAYMKEQPPPSWHDSWRVSTVDAAGWQSILDGLRQVSREIGEHLTPERLPMPPSAELLTGCVAMVAHAAYHVGAIRQLALSEG